MKRRCGDCTLCCKLLSVREIDKPAGQRCAHQCSTGCRIYHKPGFPLSCAVWSCRWLDGIGTESMRRPDRTHYVVDMMPDMIQARHNETGEVTQSVVIQVWVDPAFPDAWEDPALLAFVESAAQPMIVRYDTRRGFVVFPPNRSHDGKWHRVNSEIAESRTGSMLLDVLTAPARDP